LPISQNNVVGNEPKFLNQLLKKDYEDKNTIKEGMGDIWKVSPIG
jgi:hypothetical protein